jgi:hypothetical protein
MSNPCLQARRWLLDQGGFQIKVMHDELKQVFFLK